MSSFMQRVRYLRAPALDSPVSAPVRRTPRLLLRPYRMGDADDWLAIENDDTVREALGWPTRSTSEAIEHLRARTHHTTLRHVGDLLVLATEYAGRIIGDVSLHLRTVAPETRLAEVGWLLRSDFGGHGLATEAADAILDVAFDQAKTSLVTAVVSDGNEASSKLALRLGFRLAAHRGAATTYVLSREDRRRASSRGPAGRAADRRDSARVDSRNDRRAGW